MANEDLLGLKLERVRYARRSLPFIGKPAPAVVAHCFTIEPAATGEKLLGRAIDYALEHGYAQFQSIISDSATWVGLKEGPDTDTLSVVISIEGATRSAGAGACRDGQLEIQLSYR
jgi:hypothetical protein